MPAGFIWGATAIMTAIIRNNLRNIGADLKSKKEWLEVFPFGLAIGAANMRPVMIFKDKPKKRALPVCLSPLDAGIAVSQSTPDTETSPHELAWRILSKLGVKLEKCLFTEVRGHHQFVELKFSGNKDLDKLEARADDAISFCLRSGCRFYTTIEYIELSRVLEGQMLKAQQGQHMPEVNPHPYLN
jgi:uncharacterized protein